MKKVANERRKNSGKTQPRVYLALEIIAVYLAVYVGTFGFTVGDLNMLVIGVFIGYILKSVLPRYNKAMIRATATKFVKRYTPNDWTKNI